MLDYGADPTGVADSAPAFRACMGSNRVIVAPQGTYLLNSMQGTQPYVAIMPPAILAQNFTNFSITGYGATIRLGTGANRSTVFLFDRCSNFEVLGLTIQGDRAGLGLSRSAEIAPHSIAGDPNVGITVMSGVNFTLADLHMTGIYVYCLQGDWWVNGVVRNVTIDSSIYGFDVAYLNRVLIDHADMTGSDLTAVNSQAHPGNGGFSCIVDPNNTPYNYTGYSFTQTQHVTLRNCRASNFNTGCYFTTGIYWTLQGNRWHDNPGIGPNVGLGVFISYDAVSGVGVPVHNVVICGDTFANNGAVANGAGILFEPPSGSDFTQDVTIVGCLFDNNKVDGISPHASNTNIRRLQSIGNVFTGALQTNDIHPVLAPSFSVIIGGGVTSGPGTFTVLRANTSLTVPNNTHIQLTDASGSMVQMYVQPDNNFIWNATDGSGAPRNVCYMPQRSGTSPVTWQVPMQFASTVGFNGTAAINKPTVTGAKGSNAALASLMNVLASYGLVTDSTTA